MKYSIELKRRSLIILLAILTVSVSAQSLEVSQDVISLDLDAYLDYNEVSVTNTNSDTMTVACRLEKRCYNSDDALQVQICWGLLCFGPTNADLTSWEFDGAMVDIAPGGSSSQLSIHQFSVGSYGSNWRLYFYDFNNPSDEVFIDLEIGTCNSEDEIIAVSETSVSSFSFGVSPNPASDYLNVDLYGNSESLTFKIHDLTGRVVEEFQIFNGSITVDLSDLNQGLYLASLSDSKGMIEVKRFVVE